MQDGWIERRTGIHSRRHAADHETTTALAIDAARAALADARVPAAEVDLVLVATMSPDRATPQVAPLVAGALGAHGAAFDVGAACTGWLSALNAASALLEAGRARCAVVVGVDTLSRLLDMSDRTTAALFADGAGAAVLRTDGIGGGGRIGPLVLGSDGTDSELITCPIGGPIAMDGQATFKRAVTEMSAAALEACERAGIGLDDLDLVIPHQANSRIITAVGERLGVPSDRMFDVIAHTGNTSAGTLPIALTAAQAHGRLQDGARVLLAAFGAGLTWGAAVVQWDPPADLLH